MSLWSRGDHDRLWDVPKVIPNNRYTSNTMQCVSNKSSFLCDSKLSDRIYFFKILRLVTWLASYWTINDTDPPEMHFPLHILNIHCTHEPINGITVINLRSSLHLQESLELANTQSENLNVNGDQTEIHSFLWKWKWTEFLNGNISVF